MKWFAALHSSNYLWGHKDSFLNTILIYLDHNFFQEVKFQFIFVIKLGLKLL